MSVGRRLRHASAPAALASGATAIIGLGAWITGELLLFPSLGPTAIALAALPMEETSSPRNVVCAHTIGAVVGFAALALFGLRGEPAIFTTGVSATRVGAAALAVGLTTLLMLGFGVLHLPAGSTTLVVALGSMSRARDVVVIVVAVVALTALGWVVNRARGLPYPAWSPRRSPEEPVA